jgi:hypothetical protein
LIVAGPRIATGRTKRSPGVWELFTVATPHFTTDRTSGKCVVAYGFAVAGTPHFITCRT